jgi:DNA polymerase-3 subunit epsilon
MSRVTKNRSFWWFVLACIFLFPAVAVSFTVILWLQMSPAEQEFILGLIERHSIFIFGAGVLLVTVVGFAIDWVSWFNILPIHRIAEETGIIHGVNPGHRIRLKGSRDVVRLAAVINHAADRFEELHRSVEERVKACRADTEDDKNILSTVIAELPEGVLACNADGRITLYNERARQLWRDPEGDPAAHPEPPIGGFVGLGRSVFGIIDKDLIQHALDEVFEKVRSGRPDITSAFVVLGRNQRLLRVVTLPILSLLRELSGFVLIFMDISGQLETVQRLESLVQSMAHGLRGALASIRSAVEVILDYPGLSAEKLEQFQRIIHREALTAGSLLEQAAAEYARTAPSGGPLARMRVRDMVEIVRRKAAERSGITLEAEPAEDHLWVRVDSYALTLGLAFLLERLKAELGRDAFRCEAQIRERFIGLDFVWTGPPVRVETLRQWEAQPATIEGHSPTLRDLLTRHKAELWSQTRDEGSTSYLKILLPAMEPVAPAAFKRSTILPTARPVYFDFDLFGQPGQTPEFDDRLLTELACTVFDTETTGLDPRGGDEIVSIGAVRIVNGRLLRDECYEQLVNPRRSLPWESIRIHGIQPEMLMDQPDILQALRRFHRFAEGTILVAHNAAFDMRLLQLKEEAAGIRFGNPVLDTMLLSAVLHPAQEAHHIEAIAERLGIAVIGRHTALGDAMATAEIFLKMVALLAEMGIRTFKQACTASQKTYHARLKY